MRVFGIAGCSLETIVLSDDYEPAAGEIEMSGPRPSPDHVAQTDGTWLLPVVTVAEVKAEAARRISESGHDQYALRKISSGEDIPAEILTYAAAVRAASNEIEALDPIPADFTADSYWPEVVA